MRVTPFTFSGYPSGNVDFAARYAAADDDTQSAFDTMLRSVGRAIFADAISQPYVAITVIGHSDRQDTPGMTHQQARTRVKPRPRRHAPRMHGRGCGSGSPSRPGPPRRAGRRTHPR